MDNLPPNALQIWTDGSSLGQPGPAGAGAIVCPPSGSNVTLHSALGHGSNNLAEIWAIGLGLDCAAGLHAASPTAFSGIHIFSDSEYAIGTCSKGWLSKDYHTLTSYIRTLSTQISIPISYHKVAAHAGIPLNDEADAAAKKGALVSKSLAVSRGFADLLTAFRSCKFAAFRL
jgi:ribonuclease HI